MHLVRSSRSVPPKSNQAGGWPHERDARRLGAASIMAADFFFAPPVFDFGITEWEDVLGLATFGIIGALLALAIDEFFAFPD
jgi:hypothetical protein